MICKIELPATENPFAAPARPIGSLLQFTPQESHGHRVKVAGTVVYFEPGAALFLQDGTTGWRFRPRNIMPLPLGERIEALGFVSQGDYTPLDRGCHLPENFHRPGPGAGATDDRRGAEGRARL